MPLQMSEAKPKIIREPISAGQHPVRLVQIIDLGLQNQRPYLGEAKPPAFEIYLTFEFPHERIEIDGESRPKWKSKRIKISSHERSLCKKWYDKLDPENKFRGDWSKLIGAECAVLITHKPGKGQHEGRTFDEISDLNPVMKGMQVPELENPTTLFDLGSPDVEVFEQMPEWLQNIVKENLEFTGSKLQNLLEGNPVKYTARAPGDAPIDQDADEVAPETTADFTPSEDDPF